MSRAAGVSTREVDPSGRPQPVPNYYYRIIDARQRFADDGCVLRNPCLLILGAAG